VGTATRRDGEALWVARRLGAKRTEQRWNPTHEREQTEMDVSAIRIIAGALAVLMLLIMIWRRRKAVE